MEGRQDAAGLDGSTSNNTRFSDQSFSNTYFSNPSYGPRVFGGVSVSSQDGGRSLGNREHNRSGRTVREDGRLTPMDEVEYNILRRPQASSNGTTDLPRRILLQTDWKPFEYLSSQFNHDAIPFGSVVTYTGTASCAVAATCSEYMGMRWKAIGRHFLLTLQALIDTQGSREEWVFLDAASMRLRMKLVEGGYLTIGISSSDPAILVQITQGALWICSALRLGPAGGSGHYYSQGLQHLVGDRLSVRGRTLRLNLSHVLVPIPPEESSCWLELVDSTAVICHHFPVPRREGQRGLEASLDLLCRMASIRHAAEFQGGIVMKGPSAMLVPVRRVGDFIQWHLVCDDPDGEGGDFTHQEGLRRYGRTRALLGEVDLTCLRTTRAVVGWCSKVCNLIGRPGVDYAKICYSSANGFTSPLKVSGGSVGFQQFGIGPLNFTLGAKDSKLVFRRPANFAKVLNLAERVHILLYDTEEMRAWLVNADEVILHIIQTRLWNASQKDNVDQLGATPVRSLAYLASAGNTLSTAVDFKLPNGGESVENMTAGIWSILETLIAESVKSEEKHTGGAVRQAPERTLIGYELMGIAEERLTVEKKQHIVEKSSGGWPRLVNDTATLVLFASGLGGLLVPDLESGYMCRRWCELPKGKDFLGTTVAILKDYYSIAGTKGSRKRLTTSGLFCDIKGASFDPCVPARESACSCNRLQSIASSKSQSETEPLINDEGGIAFGDSRAYQNTVGPRLKEVGRKLLGK